MTDEKAMNGGTSSGIQIKREFDVFSDPSLCSKSPLSVVSEADNSSYPKLKYYKGSSIGNSTPGREADKDDGSNPNSPSICCTEESNSVGGGRLKFFKDGKFILELSHRKDGERTCWIPVPKKTFWPAVGTPRQESSTSLSVSDDNSSIQSSPWQRDHCWKQNSPRHNINKDLEFFFKYSMRACKMRFTSVIVRNKRRQPADNTCVHESSLERVTVRTCVRPPLETIVQSLWERVINIKTEPGIVSPRKRILRELERVSLEESNKRRARAPLRSCVMNSHSISAILAKEDDSVLRTLLRSPSPETVRALQQQTVSKSPYISSSSHSQHALYSSPTAYYTSVTPPYRTPHSLWPVHYPVSSPPLPLPMYPVPAYTSQWSHIHQPPDNPSDVPLNLSKHAG